MKEIKYFAGIEKFDTANEIINERADVVMHTLSKNYSHTGLVNNFDLGNFNRNEKLEDLRKRTVGFCGDKASIDSIESTEDYINAIDNPMFLSVYNAIEAGVIRKVFTQLESTAINVIANVDNVGVGNSKTYNIETKGLPIAQRQSYMSNVTFLNGVTSSDITITPKAYGLGVSVDLLRVLKGDVDWAAETAKVVMGMLYAQYKLCVNTLFSTTLLTSTPFAPSTFDVDDHLAIIEILETINKAPVVGYGTLPALRKINVASFSLINGQINGDSIVDDYIRNGFVANVNGINYVRLNQAFDFSQPLSGTLSDAVEQLLIPTDKVILLSAAQDKPVKLVRENFVRVRAIDPNDNSVNARQYAYFMNFDAGIATMSQFAIQGV